MATLTCNCSIELTAVIQIQCKNGQAPGTTRASLPCNTMLAALPQSLLQTAPWLQCGLCNCGTTLLLLLLLIMAKTCKFSGRQARGNLTSLKALNPQTTETWCSHGLGIFAGDIVCDLTAAGDAICTDSPICIYHQGCHLESPPKKPLTASPAGS